MRTYVTKEKLKAVEDLLINHWKYDEKYASASDFLSPAGNLWNLTFVLRDGRYFV